MIYNCMKKSHNNIEEEIKMKKTYEKPLAAKFEFNYVENVVASNTTYTGHGDMGIGHGVGGGCDHDPGHGNPHKPHPGGGPKKP